jgi:hypothetical protein
VQPGGGIRHVGIVAPVKGYERLLGHILGLGSVVEDAICNRHDPTVLLNEEPIKRALV